MSSEQPRRRFDPTPVETSSKSNRQSAQSEENTAPRKFNVQPAETTTRSSKDSNTNGQGVDQPPPRRFSPTPVETSTKSSRETQQAQQPARRFAPEPVETSVKSSKDREQSPSQPARRFAPEPVETSTKTNRQSDPPAEKPKSRLLPQPIEMTSNSNRAKSKSPQSNSPATKSPATRSPATKSPQTKSPPNEAVSPSSQPQDAPVEKPKRKFAPQLIDTSSRSRKNSDEKPSWSANHRTDISPGEESRVAYNNIGQQITIANRENTTSPTEYPRFISPFARRKERSDSTLR